MLRRLMVILGLVVLLAGLLCACGGGGASSTTTTSQGVSTADGAALLQARCTACHTLDRVTSQRQSPDWWAGTVDRMVRAGAQLSAAERATLIAYLAATYGP